MRHKEKSLETLFFGFVSIFSQTHRCIHCYRHHTIMPSTICSQPQAVIEGKVWKPSEWQKSVGFNFKVWIQWHKDCKLLPFELNFLFLQNSFPKIPILQTFHNTCLCSYQVLTRLIVKKQSLMKKKVLFCFY